MPSKIEWTDEVWNVVTGCTHAGMSGCDNCYAKRLFPRVYGRAGPAHTKSDRQFSDVQIHPERLDKPLRWRKPRRVLVCSMGDLFHKDVLDQYIATVFGVMASCPRHTFLIITKRPGRMRRWMQRAAGYPPHEFANIWLGVSASTQADIETVVPDLLATPAAMRYLNLEPLLERVDLRDAVDRCSWYCDHGDGNADHGGRPVGHIPERGVDWVIVGAESGPKRRPMEIDWARSVVAQCRIVGVPVFVKQLDLGGCVSKEPAEWPKDLRVREIPL